MLLFTTNKPFGLVEAYSEGDDYIVVCQSLKDGKWREMKVSDEDMAAIIEWLNKDKLIQNALPHWTASKREFLITGLTQEQWDEIFGAEERAEEYDPDLDDEPAF